jgi:5-methylcytosine-specific restriction endonuclease McrA
MASVPDSIRFCEECTPIPAEADGMREHQPANRAAPSTSGGLKLSGNQRALVDEFQAEYQKPRWRKGVRPRALQLYPLCVDCNEKLSEVVDHNIPARIIVAICRAERLFLDPMGGFYIMANLRGRCHKCHNAKTKIEEGQDWSAELELVLGKFRKPKAPVVKHDSFESQ